MFRRKATTASSYLDAVLHALQNHTKATLLLTYFLLTILVALILYMHYPNNVQSANFYGEDGSVYLQNILNKGWIEAAFTTFNGYFIVGLYALCGLGWVLNDLLLAGSLLSLPTAFALAAILFMSAVTCLPYILFKNIFGHVRMLLVVLAGALVPLPMSPHIVIGTIGNQKWIFLYLAFLLVVYRILNHKKLGAKKAVFIDLVILISAYTNTTVYFLVPLLFIPYIYEVWGQTKKSPWLKSSKSLFYKKDFLSLALLSALLIPQVLYVLLHGIPKLEGYLDTPFNPGRAIELFINRTYLFGITHGVNGYMNDLLAVLLFMALVVLALHKLHFKEKMVFFIGIYTAGVASLLFVINRPGITDHFMGYSPNGSGPDQFFYAQTLVMYLPIILLVTTLTLHHRNKILHLSLPILIVTFIIASGLASNAIPGERWRNASVFENDAGTFIDQAIAACQTSSRTQAVRVIVYPYKEGSFSLYAPYNQVCNTGLSAYQPMVEDLGLRVNNNDHLPITSAKQIKQTFVANEDGLNGIRLFISNFGKTTRQGTYLFVLHDDSCQKVLRTAAIPSRLIDNSFYNIRFKPLKDSSEQKYCFMLTPPKGDFDPIAIQRSKPDIYKPGQYIENNQIQSKDVVFLILYTQVK